MNDLESRLLDGEMLPEKKFENNHLVSPMRFLLCAYIIVKISLSLPGITDHDLKGTTLMAYYIGIAIPWLLYGMFIYYNVVHGKMERKDSPVFPCFRRPFIILFIVFLILFLLSNAMIVVEIYQEGINIGNLVCAILITVALVIIGKREFVYLEMCSAASNRNR